MGIKILAVGAHPDDVEIGAFGTLDTCVKRGDQVIVCSISNGNMGSTTIPRKELERVRLIEAAKASNVIGAHYTCLLFDDTTLSADNDEQVKKLTELIRSIRPEVIITHGEDDMHPDHGQANRLVLKSAVLSCLAHYECDSPPLSVMPSIYYMESVEGREMRPDIYVDISSSFENKIKALGEHASQLNFMADEKARDLFHFIEVLGGYRGWQCGVRVAEAFTHCPLLTKPTRRLLP